MSSIIQTFCVVLPSQYVIRKTSTAVRHRIHSFFLKISRSDVCSRDGCRQALRRTARIYGSDSKPFILGRVCAIVAFQAVSVKGVSLNTGVEKQSKELSSTNSGEVENVLSRTWIFIKLVFRFLQLFVTFTPLALLIPLLYMGQKCRRCWYKLFVCGIEISGPVIVKLGQWASTRRDLFSEDFCCHMSTLQRRTRPHSWHYTEKALVKAYGKAWNQMLQNIRTVPIGSGCCAQVYKAYIQPDIINTDKMKEKGMPDDGLLPVAVKVVHPNMNELLRRDLSILRAVAISITWLFPSLKWLSLEECMNDFTDLMSRQVDMTVEARNLERFTKNFAAIATVKFPQPVWSLTCSNILVETFEEGEPLLNYVISDCGRSIKTLLADIGINTILKMVFDDNFAHGDLHPGNMLVQRIDAGKQDDSYVPLLKKHTTVPLRLVIIDCGIVASLDERGKKGLRDVFTAVVNGDGRKVAELFLENSKHGCTDAESFKQSMDKIVKDALNQTVTLEKIQVSSLMTSLFTTMINHKVKLDGSFSSIILAIMVLEGLGRSLDPTVDIVKKASPFLIGVF